MSVTDSPAVESNQSGRLSLRLSSEADSYYEFGPIGLHTELLDPDSRLSRGNPCPPVLSRMRWSDGFTRFYYLDYINKPCRVEALTPSVLDLLLSQLNQFISSRRGDVTVELALEMPDGRKPSNIVSNPISFHVLDLDSVARNWEPDVDGLSISLTMDDRPYPIGYEAPLHIATRDFSSPVKAYSPTCGESLTVVLMNSAGQVLVSKPHVPVYCSGPGPRVYKTGKPIGIDIGLRADEIFPDRPGSYTVQALWRPLIGSLGDKPHPAPFTLMTRPVAFTVVPEQK
jgi:hypothetical protein